MSEGFGAAGAILFVVLVLVVASRRARRWVFGPLAALFGWLAKVSLLPSYGFAWLRDRCEELAR